MKARSTPAPGPADLSSSCLEHAPAPMATVEGPMHILRYVNPAFCRRIDKARGELLGKPFRAILPEDDECLARLDRMGKSESHTELEHSEPRAVFSSYAMWPVTADERTVGVVIQVSEPAPLHARAVALNEALLLGSLRQHELAAAADSSNIQLQTEIVERKQREHDALMLANEISHRIKNNLQIVAALIGYEAKRTAAPCVQGYEAMQVRIGAIAELYDVISRSSRGTTVPVAAYLGEMVKTMSASLLGSASDIKIEVEAQALEIDAVRAVPFGLLVNELATNAIKHAFRGGPGRIRISLAQIGDQVELTVADNGGGLQEMDPARTREKHGADYVAMFVRQLGGTIASSGPEAAGTIVTTRFPLLPRSPLQ